MFATETKKLKSYPQTIFGFHLSVILDLESIQVKMYNHMRWTTAYSQNFPKDTNLIIIIRCIGKKINLKKMELFLHKSDNWPWYISILLSIYNSILFCLIQFQTMLSVFTSLHYWDAKQYSILQILTLQRELFSFYLHKRK